MTTPTHSEADPVEGSVSSAIELTDTLRWRVCGASTAGESHRRKGHGTDDAFAYGVRGDFVVAVVADGAGSVTGTSAWGAYTACEAVVSAAMTPRFVTDFTDPATEPSYARELMRWLFDLALHSVCNTAQSMGLPTSLLSTTLSVVIARPGLAVVAQIGDGVIALERASNIDTVLTENKDGYANLTWFLQSENAFTESYRVQVDREVTAFALSTDGLAYKITTVATGAAFPPFFRSSWEAVRAGADNDDFTHWLDSIPDDQTGDDKTILLACLTPHSSAGVDTSLVRPPTVRSSSGWPPPLPIP